ncbi:MAG: aromatic ring-hydroxylating dioxygenase subunit alpha [Proteobacteria bacterium]|nr:aromatic ring-hydroxylating dioxygenase subunit alpha [Pseudomonadota bacterium]
MVVINRVGGTDSFDPGNDPAWSLDGRYYTDPDIFAAEREAVFFRNWLLVGHVSRLRQPGDFFTVELFDQPVAVLRGRDGTLRAFHNVCQHRGHRLLRGDGNVKAAITCPYHAWAYDTTGALRNAPNCENVEGFDREAVRLSAVGVETMAGFVFVNLDPDAVPLARAAPGMEQELLDFAPQSADLVHAWRVTYPVKANWKVCVENWSECYHCDPVHPMLMQEFIDQQSHHIVCHGIWQRQFMNLHEKVLAAVDVEARASVRREQASWTLWPHMGFQVVLQGYLSAFTWLPVDADTTIFCEDWFFPSKDPTPEQQALIRFRADFTQPEDDRICEEVQAGLKSRGYRPGRLMVDRGRGSLSEHSVLHLQHLAKSSVDGWLATRGR